MTPESTTNAIIDADTRFAARLTAVDDTFDYRMKALESAETRIRERARTIEGNPEKYARAEVDDLVERIRRLKTAERERRQVELNLIHEESLSGVVKVLDAWQLPVERSFAEALPALGSLGVLGAHAH